MELAHPGPSGVQNSFSHLDPFVSVTRKVELHGRNDKLDVMLVQYFLTKLGTWCDAECGDDFVDQFRNGLRLFGPFLIDGKFGNRSFDTVFAYQVSPETMTFGAAFGMKMKADGGVSPCPDQNRGVPVTRKGYIFTIAHMAERIQSLRGDWKDIMTKDPIAPEEFRAKARELFGFGGGNTNTFTASGQAARGRHFPPRGR